MELIPGSPPIAALESPTAIVHETKTVTFDGTTGAGEVGSITLLDVTNIALLHHITARCTTSLVSAGGGTLALGVTGATGAFIAATTATDIDAGELWHSTSPGAGPLDSPINAVGEAITTDLLLTIATDDITAGTIVFDFWFRVPQGGSVEVA